MRKNFRVNCFILSKVIIVLKTIIKKGLTNSTGWNLGKKKISSHLFEPLTSVPNIGTKDNNIKDIKKE